MSNSNDDERKVNINRSELPEGWVVAGHEPGNIAGNNLRLATKITEDLINDIEQRTTIKVPESYLHVEDDGTFHAILLVSSVSFHCPQIAVAHMLADERTQKEGRFDIHFTFSIYDEYHKKVTLAPEYYTLKHVHHQKKVQAGAYPHFLLR